MRPEFKLQCPQEEGQAWWCASAMLETERWRQVNRRGLLPSRSAKSKSSVPVTVCLKNKKNHAWRTTPEVYFLEDSGLILYRSTSTPAQACASAHTGTHTHITCTCKLYKPWGEGKPMQVPVANESCWAPEARPQEQPCFIEERYVESLK